MLDSFLEVAYETQTRKKAHFELVGLLKELPDMELRKIAAGVPLAELYGSLDKTAGACGPDGEPLSFLDRFKGTPLFEQAIALEQQELQAEMADMQKRQENRAARQSEDSLYDVKDRLRVQKRLLELELAKQDGGGGDPAADPNANPVAAMQPGAAPPPMAPPGAGPPAPGPLPGAPGEVKAAAAEKIAFADNLGRQLARADAVRAGHAEALRKVGAAAGAALAKTALDVGAVGSAAKSLLNSGGAQKALGWAAKNPGAAGALAGAGVGAVGGAVTGGKDHRLSGALTGAAGGAALGGGAAGIGGRMHAGQGLAQAATNTARSAVNAGGRAASAMQSAIPGSLGTKVTDAVQKAQMGAHGVLDRMGG